MCQTKWTVNGSVILYIHNTCTNSRPRVMVLTDSMVRLLAQGILKMLEDF